MRGVTAGMADTNDGVYSATTRVHSDATLVRLPSDKFTSDGYRTVTFEEWKRCQANTYGPERV